MYNSQLSGKEKHQSFTEECLGDFKVLLVVNHLVHQNSELYVNGIDFKCVDHSHALTSLKNYPYDVVMILYGDKFGVDKTINAIKLITGKRNMPLLLYSPEHSADARRIAIEHNFDDYHYGEINGNTKKKLDIILKSKKNKPMASQNNDGDDVLSVTPLKRTFDVLVASTAVLALSPLFLLIAFIIKLDSKGPVFYISRRAGKNYQVFNFIKFRSMYLDADANLREVSSGNQYGNGIFIKIKNDPRVTPVGKFLRKTSLDELPQLFNVIKGDMSIVGNRPLPLYEARQLTKDNAARRFLAPAGVTGLWQVTKRGKDDMSDDERISLDIEYARKYSLWYDLRLIFSTIPALIQKEAV